MPIATARGRLPRAALGFIFATALMDAVSFGIVIPVYPDLIKGFVGGNIATAAQWIAILSVVWGVVQLFCGPALGMLSDRIGRRPVLLISMFGLAVDFFVMAYAPNLTWLLIGRVLNAATASSFSTINAYITDVTEPDRRARAFGWIGSALSLGFLGGPALGGLLAGIDLHFPFVVAGGLTALNWIYGCVVLPESLPPGRRTTHFDLRKINPLASLAFLKEHGDGVGLAVLAFVFPLAWTVGPAVFVLYTNYRYGWSPGTVGFVMMASGAMGSLVQMALVGPIVARFGERGAVLAGAAAGAIGFACFGVAATSAGYLAAIPIFAFMNLFMPGLQGLMTQCLLPSEQGRLQGALQGLQSLASILGPLLFGLVFAWSIRDDTAFRIPGLTYFIASALSFVVLLVAFKVARVTGRNVRREASMSSESQRQTSEAG